MSEPAAACKPGPPGAPARAGALLLLDPATPAGATLRTTLAGVLAMALAFALHVEVPALAVVFVLARGSAGAVTMLAGAVAGNAAAIVLLALFDQASVAFSLALFGLTALATYAALGRRFPYAYVQGLLSFLILVGQGLDTPQSTVRHAFYDLANVIIAAFAAFVAGSTQPVGVAAQLQNTLATTLRGCGALLDEAGGRSGQQVLRLELLSRRLRVLLAASWPTRLVSRARRDALRAAVAGVSDLVRHVLAIDGATRVAHDPSAATGERARLRDATSSVAPLLAAQHGPIAADRTAARAAARTRAAALRVAPAAASGRQPLPLAIDAGARRALARLALLAPDLLPGTRLALLVRTDAPHRDAPPARIDRFRLRHAVKSAAAYLLILWCWEATQWGAIVPALVVAVLVATLATPLGATLTKAVLRVGGALAGGLAGLAVAVLLLPFITSLPAICAVSGVALFAFLWLQQHSERLAFASLQAAIAFTLTLVHGTGPSPTWREPLESVIGLAFGISVVVGVMHAVWPLDATTSAHDVLAELLEGIGRRFALLLADAAGPTDHHQHGRERALADAARAHAAGFAHEVELYGPQFGRPREHLRELLRLTVELEALLSLLEDAPQPAPEALPAALARERAVLGATLELACRTLAADTRALPGEPAPPTLERIMAGLVGQATGFAAAAETDAGTLALTAWTATVATGLLACVREQLASPAHREPHRHVA